MIGGLSKKQISLAALILVFVGSAASIRMSPGAFTAQGVPIGTKHDLRVPLVIQLDENSEKSIEFISEPLSPSEVRESWLDGYEEIPDPDYLIIDGEHPIVAHPDSPVVRRMFIEFPNDSSLLNRHFLVQLRVGPKKTEGVFQTVLIGSYLIETKSSVNRFTHTGGEHLTIAPSVLNLDSSGKGIIRVYNNDKIGRRFEIIPKYVKNERALTVNISGGFQEGDIDLVKTNPSNAKISPGGFIDVEIEYKPNTIEKDTEIILWFEDPDLACCSRFCRIRLKKAP